MKFTLFTVVACGLFALTSCTKDSVANEQVAPSTNDSFILDDNENGVTDAPTYDFGAAIIEHVKGHSLDFTSVEKVTMDRPNGTRETMYRLDGDVNVTEDELNELKDLDARGGKQYHTDNLVSKNFINVIGFTGAGFNLTSKMQAALQMAVANYNALNTNKTFNLTFGSSTNGDIIVYRNASNENIGGSAQFPSGGNPGKWIEILNGMETQNLNTNEHLMTHEMGHTMGLRHTDWYSRQSCGQFVNEGFAGVGLNYIPGTPFFFDPNSVMLACFQLNNEDGEFGFYDRVALEFLY